MDKWLTHPTSLKIISVLLGLLLFAVVHIDPETSPQTVSSNVDTKVIEAATIIPVGLDRERFVLTAMEPTVARLVVEGRISTLLATNNDEYIVEMDLTNVRPGIQEVALRAKLPRGIREIELSPSKVTVQIEEIVTETFEAQVIVEGQPAQGFVLGTPEIISESGNVVRVTLPRDDMSRVGVVAATLDIDGADKTVSNKKARLVVYDTEGREIPNAIIIPDVVHAEVRVTLPFKQVPLQIRFSGSLPDGLSLVSVKPEMDQVTVYAEQERLNAIQIYDGAVLDLSKVRQSGPVKVKTPATEGIQAVAPGEIELEVTVESAVARTVSGVPINIVGAVDGFPATVQTPEGGRIDIELSGAESILSRVRAADIRVAANISGLDPGTHTVQLEVELPQYVQLAAPGGQSLTAVIEIVDPDAVEEEPDDVAVGGPPPSTEPEEPPASGDNGGNGGNSGNGGGSQVGDNGNHGGSDNGAGNGGGGSDHPDSGGSDTGTDNGEEPGDSSSTRSLWLALA